MGLLRYLAATLKKMAYLKMAFFHTTDCMGRTAKLLY